MQMKFGLFEIFNPARDAPDAHGIMRNCPATREAQAAAYDIGFREIEAAEEMGWDSVWWASGPVVGNIVLDPAPLVLGAAIAARTKRVQIGSAVHLPMLKYSG